MIKLTFWCDTKGTIFTTSIGKSTIKLLDKPTPNRGLENLWYSITPFLLNLKSPKTISPNKSISDLIQTQKKT